MKQFVNKFKTFWSKLNKKALVVGLSVLAIAGITVGVSLAWGPNRTTFTLDQINNERVLDKNGNRIVLNSIKDDSVEAIAKAAGKKTWINDETQFVNAKEYGVTTSDDNNGWSGHSAPIKVEPGKTYRVRAWVHNNNPNDTAATATGVTAWSYVGTDTPELTKAINVYLCANNAEKNYGSCSDKYGVAAGVYDSVDFVSANGQPFYLVADGSSIEYSNNWKSNVKLNDGLFHDNGVKLGYDKYDATKQEFDGNIPGCYQYTGEIFFNVTPVFTENTNLEVTKNVAVHTDDHKNYWDANKPYTNNFGDKLDITKDDIKSMPKDKDGNLLIDYQIKFANKSQFDAYNVSVRDQLPSGDAVIYVPGSTYTFNNVKQGLDGDGITKTGLLVTTGTGHMNPVKSDTALSLVAIFTAKIDQSKLTCGVKNTLVNTAIVGAGLDGKGYEGRDTATVTIDGPDCPKPVDKDPVYICKTLEADKKSVKPGETVKFTVHPEFADGLKDGKVIKVEPTSYAFTYGDGAKLDATDKNSVDHQYEKVGNYVATAKVQFKVGGNTTEYVGSTDCQISINVADAPTPPPTPTTPPVITETGAGLAIGSILGGGVLAYALAGLAVNRKKNL
jgi:uncharacterized repeat protein (TIGR01451 family)